MPMKRASVDQSTFNNPTAIEKMVSGTPADKTQQRGADDQEVKAPGGRVHKPTSFYLDEETLRYLDRLAYEYNDQKGVRINRNHIVRFLTKSVQLGDLLKVNLKEY